MNLQKDNGGNNCIITTLTNVRPHSNADRLKLVKIFYESEVIMKLSRKKSIELCVELWTWCAETGEDKEDWPRWPEFGSISNNCWFCEYDYNQWLKYETHSLSECFYCPLKKHFSHCTKAIYGKWVEAKTRRTRKKYAALFLAQIKEIYAERYV